MEKEEENYVPVSLKNIDPNIFVKYYQIKCSSTHKEVCITPKEFQKCETGAILEGPPTQPTVLIGYRSRTTKITSGDAEKKHLTKPDPLPRPPHDRNY